MSQQDTTSTLDVTEWLSNNCDGAGPHSGPAETRTRSIGGGGNLILCLGCWAQENKHAYNMGRESGNPNAWQQQDFYTAHVYDTMGSGFNDRTPNA